MFSTFLKALNSRLSLQPQKAGRPSRRLCLESLEERAMLSGGPLLSIGNGPQVGIVTNVSGGGTGGGNGTTGGTNDTSTSISGQGYPIVPTSGPGRPGTGTLTQQGTTTTLIPLSGGGGNGPSIAAVPVCLGSPGGPGA
jgi:hypothetical protein